MAMMKMPDNGSGGAAMTGAKLAAGSAVDPNNKSSACFQFAGEIACQPQ